MRQGTWRWALTVIGLIASGMGLSFAGSRLLHIPGVWPAAIPIVLYALIIIAYGWHAGSVRFHAVRAAKVGACGIAVLVLFDWMTRGATTEYVWLLAVYGASFMAAPELRSRSEIERAAKAPPSKWQQHMQYVVLVVGMGLFVFFVIQAARQ